MNQSIGRNLIAITALTLAFHVATAQKTTTKPTGNTAANSSELTEQQAYGIIKYSNAIIDLHNSYMNALESHQSTLENTADQNEKKLQRNKNTQPFFIQCDRNNLPEQTDKTNRTILNRVPSVPEKQSLQQLSTQALYWYDNTNKWCASISQYFSEKQYVADATFAQYAVMKDSLQNSIKQSAVYWQKLGKTASIIGDRAELVLLKKSKLAVYVIPMKQCLMGIKEVNGMLSDTTVSMDTISNKLAVLQAFIQQNADTKNIDFSKLKDIYYKDVYNAFFRNCSYSVTTLQSLVEKIRSKASEQNLSSTYSSANTSYNNAIERYNTFIKQ